MGADGDPDHHDAAGCGKGARMLLLGRMRRRSPACCGDYDLPADRPSASKTIHRHHRDRSGMPLDDILDEEDNAAVADFITEEVRATHRRPEGQSPRLDRRRAQDDGVLRRLCAVAVRARAGSAVACAGAAVVRVRSTTSSIPAPGVLRDARVHLGDNPARVESFGCATGCPSRLLEGPRALFRDRRRSAEGAAAAGARSRPGDANGNRGRRDASR